LSGGVRGQICSGELLGSVSCYCVICRMVRFVVQLMVFQWHMARSMVA